MKSVAILACNNGLGHIKRACILNQLLLNRGIDVKLYGDESKINLFTNSKKIKKLNNIININNLPDALTYKYCSEDSITSVFREFSKRINSSFLISDNYYEPFLFGCEGALLANFLWTDLIDNHKTGQILKKLEKFSKLTILTSPFAKNYLKDCINREKVKIFGESKPQLNDKNYIFICKGFGNWTECFENEIEDYFINNKNIFLGYKILYDKNFKNLNLPSVYNCEKYLGNLTDDFIGHASCIVGRPSVGILTDSLSLKIPFIPVFSSKDKESLHNSEVLKNLYPKTMSIKNTSISEQRKIIKKLDLDMNGEHDAINFIHKKISR